MDWLSQALRRPPVEWVDLLDIAIVAVLVYELLVLIKGTRAMQIALSGGFLIGFYFLSEWLGLETVNWLIRNLAVYGVFAIIVLLQTDIRRALAHFGRAPFFRFFDRSTNVDEAVEELVISVSNLAARKIGAIIVHRAPHRPAQPHRGRHSARRRDLLRPARQHLPGGVAAARRRGDRPGRSHCRRGLLPAALGEPQGVA